MPVRSPRRAGGRRARPEAVAAASLAAAQRHLAGGRNARCFAICQDVLDGHPGHPGALKLLSTLARGTGHPEAALDFAAAALFGAPRDPAIHVEYALAREALGCTADAELALHRALACEPTPEAFGHLARLLAAGHRHEEALDAATAALHLAPDAAAHRRRAAILAEMGRSGDAAEAYGRALALDSADVDAHFALARLFLADGDGKAAARALQACLRLDPADSRGTAGLLRRLAPAPAIDGRAARIATRARLLKPLALRALDSRRRKLAVLELGCGAGASPWRGLAKTLAAVDDDAARFAAVRARAAHDALDQASPIAHLAAAAPASWDVVVAPDALVGTAALAPVFAAAAAALRPGGVFVLALHANDLGTEIAILPGGEIRHGEGYVRRTAAAAGFEIAALERTRAGRRTGPAALLIALRAAAR